MKKLVDDWLNEVDYSFPGYTPSEETLKFINFIHLASEGMLENKTPTVHLKIADNLFKPGKRHKAILCHRGLGKSSLVEWLLLYIAAFGYCPGFGKVEFAIFIGDSIENGVKTLRKNIEYKYQNSTFLQKLIPNVKIKYNEDENSSNITAAGRQFTDVRMEFANVRGDRFVVKSFGVLALALDTCLYTADGYTTIGECKVGDKIFGADGKLTTIVAKSEVFEKQMYEIVLKDGRKLKVSEDHINPVIIREKNQASWIDTEKNLQTFELLKYPISKTLEGKNIKKNTSYSYEKELMFVKNVKPLEYSEKKFEIDPYTLGLLLGDGRLRELNGCMSCELSAHKDDWAIYKTIIPYEHGTERLDKRNNHVITTTIKGLTNSIRALNIACLHDKKFIPEKYFFGSIKQRLELLQGLMDTDGSISEDRGSCYFCTTSISLAKDVQRLVWSLGGKACIKEKENNGGIKLQYLVHIRINLPIFKLPRKVERQKYNREEMTAIVAINKIPLEKSQCIAVDNEEHQFIAGEYFRTHNTGIRGTRELGTRPTLAIADDIVSDEDARSETSIKQIENTMHKAVRYALSPTKNRIIWLGTPFNAKDPLYKVVESGAWDVSVYPVAEKFPCTREEFKGSWEDRFNYDYVKASYDESVATGQVESFNQELMLRIMSSEDRLIEDSDLIWFNKEDVLKNRYNFNFYITTSEKKSSDYSVITVWAYSSNGDWLAVDGLCKQQTVDKTIDELFRYASLYNPLGVGIEVTGQQKGFVSWIQSEMIKRNIFFTLLSSQNNGEPGIRPVGDKFSRFHLFTPIFKQKKVWIANQLKGSEWGNEFEDEISKVGTKGFKSKHDDVLDTIAMLGTITAYKPSSYKSSDEDSLFHEDRFSRIKNTMF